MEITIRRNNKNKKVMANNNKEVKIKVTTILMNLQNCNYIFLLFQSLDILTAFINLYTQLAFFPLGPLASLPSKCLTS